MKIKGNKILGGGGGKIGYYLHPITIFVITKQRITKV